MGELLQELKRRNVFRVGVAYLIAAWLIVEVISTIREPLGLPDWTEAFFIVVVVAGFPVALIFAWAFELTPEGLKKTHEVAKEESVTADTGKKLNIAIIAVLCVALTYFIVERQFLHDHVEDDAAEAVGAVEQSGGTSIAVLPFVNMSADAEQEYFSDGISEELLNLLAKIPELRVAARTSSFQFKGQNLDISDVAKQLKVDHVLEGSVRKANTRVRITAQLIDADSGYHLWSDTYDRELTDIFGIQDEISAAIVAALSETLGIAVESAPQTTASVADSEAYNAYLLGLHLIKRRTRADIETSVEHFQRAIETDPEFAPAHAYLALGSLLLRRSGATYGDFTLEEALSVAEPAIARALELDPEFADAHAINGLMLDSMYRYDEATEAYETALRLNPSSTETRNWYATMMSEIGRPAEALVLTREAYELDPLSVLAANNYASSVWLRRDFDEFDKVVKQMEHLDPVRATSFRAMGLESRGRIADGVIELFRASDMNPDQGRVKRFASWSLYNLDLIEEARRVWPYEDVDYVFGNLDDHERLVELALQQYKEEPGDPGSLSNLAWTYVYVGDNDSAREWTDKYLDHFSDTARPQQFENLIYAMIEWRKGRNEELDPYLTPLEDILDEWFESGVDFTDLHWTRATAAYLRSDLDGAAGAMEIALSREPLDRGYLEFIYRSLEMDQHPRLATIKADYEARIGKERQRFLTYACGEIGFTSWKPLENTCGEVEQASL